MFCVQSNYSGENLPAKQRKLHARLRTRIVMQTINVSLGSSAKRKPLGCQNWKSTEISQWMYQLLRSSLWLGSKHWMHAVYTLLVCMFRVHLFIALRCSLFTCCELWVPQLNMHIGVIKCWYFQQIIIRTDHFLSPFGFYHWFIHNSLYFAFNTDDVSLHSFFLNKNKIWLQS